MKTALKTLIALIIIGTIGFTNYIDRYTIGERFYFQNRDQSFVFEEVSLKGYSHSLKYMEIKFSDWKKESGSTDTIIYRTSKKNYLKFWNWEEYLFHPRWDYPYLERE